jgi:nucleoside 2-deoxyribosyltransferase
MRYTFIGSESLIGEMKRVAETLWKKGHTVYLPLMDKSGLTAIDICKRNRYRIKKANEVWVFWNGHSIGTMIDFGMAFGLGKKVFVYRNGTQHFGRLVKDYQRECFSGKRNR